MISQCLHLLGEFSLLKPSVALLREWLVSRVTLRPSGLCLCLPTIFNFTKRWLGPGCLPGEVPPWFTPEHRTEHVWEPLSGQEFDLSNSYSLWIHLWQIKDEWRRSGTYANCFCMLSSVFHPIYKMLLHFPSYPSGRLLHTE